MGGRPGVVQSTKRTFGSTAVFCVDGALGTPWDGVLVVLKARRAGICKFDTRDITRHSRVGRPTVICEPKVIFFFYSTPAIRRPKFIKPPANVQVFQKH